MEALGRNFNLMPKMDNVYISLKDAGVVGFLGFLASTGDTYTITEAKDVTPTGAQALVQITRYWTCTGDGSDAWVLHTQAAASTAVATSAANQSAIFFEIGSPQLSDGYAYLKCASTGAGTVTAVLSDLAVGRSPANLTAVGL